MNIPYIFNARKLKEKDRKIEMLEADIDGLHKEIERLRAQLSGGRICGSHCGICKNGIANLTQLPYHHTYYTCKLDVKCKDFSQDR